MGALFSPFVFDHFFLFFGSPVLNVFIVKPPGEILGPISRHRGGFLFSNSDSRAPENVKISQLTHVPSFKASLIIALWFTTIIKSQPVHVRANY
jgi:hypothetical protein